MDLFTHLFFWPRCIWNLSSLIRDRTWIPCSESTDSFFLKAEILNHWTARDVSGFINLITIYWLHTMHQELCSKKKKTNTSSLKNSPSRVGDTHR